MTAEKESQDKESLLTTRSLQLSLSPPRCAPYGTLHRSLMLGVKPSDTPYAEHHYEFARSDFNKHSGLRERLMHLIYNSQLESGKIPHPHLPVGPESADQITRFLGSILPLRLQNRVRDSGGFRAIADNLVTSSIPVAAVSNPSASLRFLKLSKQCFQLRYGEAESQFMDMFFPEDVPEDRLKGMVFFVHGGAWGSGKPWFYRLAALPFLEMQLAVAIVGYRVYPLASDVHQQVQDLEAAYKVLSERYPKLCGLSRTDREVGFCTMGHSSGAHILLLMLVEQAKRSILLEQARINGKTYGSYDTKAKCMTDAFVGISGPYDISHHFDYEAARGVEEISPMKAANGHTRENFRMNSPAHRLQDFLVSIDEESFADSGLQDFFPPALLVHGIEDETVPFTATSEAARILRDCGVVRCQEFYAPLTGHQEAVMHLMLGGRVKDGIVDWLSNYNEENHFPVIRSKL